MVPDKYCVGGKEYGIYNLYYDTKDDFLIRESIAKPYYKEKLRLRSYTVDTKPDTDVFLEIKKKIGGIVTKRRITISLEEAMDYLNYGIRPKENGKFIHSQIIGEFDAFFKTYSKLTAKQFISYQREAYFGKDDDSFRLTFDRHLVGRRTDVCFNGSNDGRLLIPEESRLMEVKIGKSMPIWLADCLAELGIYKTSFSKYGKAYKDYIKERFETKKRRLSYYA
jgi:hypothetical protein